MTKAIIFDCWGTLFTNSQSPHPFEKFANKIGYTISDRTFVKAFEHHLMLNTYNDLRVPIRTLLNDLAAPHDEQLVNELKDILLGSVATQIAYPDTMRNLQHLKDKYTLVLLTNSFKQGYEGLKEKFDVDRIFKGVITSFESHHIKPDGEAFKPAIALTDCDLRDIVVVGDNLHDDIEPAHNLGMSAILLDRKRRYQNFKERITTLDEVQRAIDHIERSFS